MEERLYLLNEMIKNATMPMAVYITKELIVECANPSMVNAWGKDDMAIGKKYLEVLPAIHKQQLFEQAMSVFETGIPAYAQNIKTDFLINDIVKSNYYNYNYIPLFNADKSIYGVMNIGTDVTSLQDAKQQIQLSEERLRMAIDNSGIGTYEIDLFTKKIKTSGNFNTLWSIDHQNVTNQELIAKLHPDDLNVREQAHEEAKYTGKIYYEARILNEDNSVRWVKIHGKIINDKNSSPATIIGIIQDIDKERQFEHQLKKQVAENTTELKRSNNDLLHFAHIVSHDLREPARKIKFFTDRLRNEKGIDLNENQSKYLYKMDQSAQRMQTTIEGILSYSSLNNSSQSIEKVNLNEIVESIKTDLELIIQEKGAILIADEIPQIEGAPVLLYQLFYNLIQNALKFSKADQPPRVIITSSLIKDNGTDSIQITVKDNGIGIDPIFSDKIFTAFERLHSKDQYEGNGLGLSLCRKIAERHNGKISVVSEKDNGAEFIITLPLKQSTNNI